MKISNIKKLGENDKIIIKNIIGAFSIKGFALLISLYTMPAYINYFDNQAILGLWFTMLSVLSWILTFDLGIGNGLRNNLVPLIVNNKTVEIKRYISSAYMAVGAIITFAIIVACIIFNFIDWNFLFNIDSSVISNSTLKTAIYIIFIGIMLQFLLKLVTSILYAMQKSALINLITLITSIINLLYVMVYRTNNIEVNLILLAIVNILAVNVPLLLVTVYVFTKKLKGCYPSIKYFSKKYAHNVIKLGGIFFWVQIMYMILTTTNEFLITWLVSPDMVVEYQIYNKLFTIVGILFTIALTPVWSAVTKAISENNYEWIKALYKKMKLLTIVGVVLQFLLAPFLQVLVNMWLGEGHIQVNFSYAILFAVLGSLMIWNGVISSIVNGFGKLKIQAVCFTCAVVIKIPLALILVNILESWIGIIIANILALSIYCFIEPIRLRRLFSKLEKENVE